MPATADAFEMKTGDLAPPLRGTLVYADGTVPDLSTALGVKFVMKTTLLAATTTIDAAVVVVDGPTASLRYDWVDGDTDAPGDYLGEFRVEWEPNVFETFPSDGQMCIHIDRGLEPTA